MEVLGWVSKDCLDGLLASMISRIWSYFRGPCPESVLSYNKYIIGSVIINKIQIIGFDMATFVKFKF
jgi:hypothetical protein